VRPGPRRECGETRIEDNQRAFQAARKLEAGGATIDDNSMRRADQMPCGGAMGSGIGREGLRCTIEEMREMKSICWKV
jgi:acyl-CoA reductase-like NAD-dependent aldehyde dehydrogenase